MVGGAGGGRMLRRGGVRRASDGLENRSWAGRESGRSGAVGVGLGALVELFGFGGREGKRAASPGCATQCDDVDRLGWMLASRGLGTRKVGFGGFVERRVEISIQSAVLRQPLGLALESVGQLPRWQKRLSSILGPAKTRQNSPDEKKAQRGIRGWNSLQFLGRTEKTMNGPSTAIRRHFLHQKAEQRPWYLQIFFPALPTFDVTFDMSRIPRQYLEAVV